MHWKIRRDPYFASLCRVHGEAAVHAAGFFFDDAADDAPLDDVSWLCTPRPKLPVTGSRPVVLLATGGFCPLHEGHLSMMEHARAAVTAAGYEVVGGYLSPGHDAYLRMKCGAAAIPAQERLLQCGGAVEGSDWLSVDPWEAMHRQVAVNYTDVTARLQTYLRTHVDRRLEVFYVCGADNARFAFAFSEQGGCVVVGRPGAESEFESWQNQLKAKGRIFWVAGAHPGASREMRTLEWEPEKKRRIVIRLEDRRAVGHLGPVHFEQFQAELVVRLALYATVRSLPLVEPDDDGAVISLDPMLPATHNLAISRLFSPGGYEARGHVPRPGSQPLDHQIAVIPPGDYALRDDDRVTGRTLAAVAALLPAGIGIRATRFAIEHAPDEDVLDARDFLLGADHGGLVIASPRGGVGRAPYLLPYVDPAARASIPASHDFSIDLWLLNARTFAPTNLRVRDLPPSSRVLFPDDPDLRLEALCAWHADQLRRIAPGARSDR